MTSVDTSVDSSNNSTYDTCEQKYHTYQTPPGDVFCNWTWDSVLCWPPTRASTTATQKCPKDRGVDPTKYAYKRCSMDGRWEGRIEGDFTLPQGWTNYTPCFTPEMLDLLRKLYTGSEENANVKLNIALRTRTLEIAGFSLSLVALLLSLAIFFRFTSLRNNRTRIHRNLFIAMVIQVVIRLTLYIDQFIIRGGYSNIRQTLLQGIDNTPFLCEASYVLLEYARTAMFMWMFIEGLYLHNKITVTVFHERSYYATYSILGWGIPVILTAAWAGTTAWHYSLNYPTKCWFGYNLTAYFWILEGPRLGVVLLNILFLLNIIRVLVVKLRQSHTSEIEQVRKAVRAAVVLVPLLGITNILSMVQVPLEKTVVEFAIWSYGTHFLTSFQGFFIAFLYCFLNGEVRTAVMKSISIYFSLRTTQFQTRRNSGFSGMFVTAVENPVEQESEMLAQRAQVNAGCINDHRERLRRQRKSQEHNRSRWISLRNIWLGWVLPAHSLQYSILVVTSILYSLFILFRLCCRGGQPQPPDQPPNETRV